MEVLFFARTSISSLAPTLAAVMTLTSVSPLSRMPSARPSAESSFCAEPLDVIVVVAPSVPSVPVSVPGIAISIIKPRLTHIVVRVWLVVCIPLLKHGGDYGAPVVFAASEVGVRQDAVGRGRRRRRRRSGRKRVRGTSAGAGGGGVGERKDALPGADERGHDAERVAGEAEVVGEGADVEA